MTHAPHDKLPGFRPDQLLHDGCEECEHRGRHPAEAIANLDPIRFEAAWRRAAIKQRHGLPTCSHAELTMLDVLAAVQIQLDRRGIPFGEPPALRQPLADLSRYGEGARP